MIPTEAAVIYVSKTGNGSAPLAGTETGALTSMAAAFARTNPGDTIYFFSGTYDEDMTLFASDTDPIFFVGQDSRTTTIRATGSNTLITLVNVNSAFYCWQDLTLWSTGSSSLTSFGESPTIMIKNCELRCTTTHAIYPASCNLTIINSLFNGCGDGGGDEGGLYFSSMKSVRVSNSRFRGCNPVGIYVGGSDSFLVEDCVFDRNVKDGIISWSSQPREFQRSSFYNNGNYGINFQTGDDTIITSNCLFVGNDSAGVNFSSAEGQILNSTFVNNRDGIYWGIFNGQYVRVRNNIFSDNRRAGLYIKTNSNMESFTYNLFHNATNVFDDPGVDTRNTANEINAVRGGANNIVAPVYFVSNTGDSTGDYHESGRSPAVDRGDTTSAYSTEPAPNGSRINIGRYGNTASAATSDYFTFNRAPQVMIVQRPQGQQNGARVRVIVDVSDTDADDAVRMRVEYSMTGSFHDTPTSATVGSVSAAYGSAAVDNSRYYQIGTPASWIRTSSGTNRIAFDWDLTTDLGVGANDTLYLRVLVNDGIDTCILPAVTDKFTDGFLRVKAAGGMDYTTINGAMAAAQNGDTIYVYAGTYNENAALTAHVALIGEDSSTVIIQGIDNGEAAVYLRGDTGFYYVEGVTAQGSTYGLRESPNPSYCSAAITVHNCRFRDNSYVGIAPNSSWSEGADTTLLTVENCEMSRNGYGFISMARTRTQIRNCIIALNDSDGINAQGSSDTIDIIGCLVTENGMDGIRLGTFIIGGLVANTRIIDNAGDGISWGADSVLVRNCVFHHNGGSGSISTSSSQGIEFRNCIFSRNGADGFGYGIEDWNGGAGGTMHPRMEYNLFSNNWIAGVVTDTGLFTFRTTEEINALINSSNNIGDSKGFMFDTPYVSDLGDSRGDYRLRYASPFIDTGDPADNYASEPQPNGGRINIGAYGGTTGAETSPPVGTPPVVVFETQPLQLTNGSGHLRIGLRLNDTQHDTLQLRALYSFTGAFSGEEATASLASAPPVGYGSVSVDTALSYPVYNLSTVSDTNTLLLTWLSASDSLTVEDTSVYIRVMASDGFAITTVTSAAFIADNRTPHNTGDLRDSGNTFSSVYLGFGSPATDAFFARYRLYYDTGGSVTESSTQWSGSETVLTSRTFGGADSVQVTGLVMGETYGFLLMAYDSYGNKASTVKLLKSIPSLIPPVIQSITIASSSSGYLYAGVFTLDPVTGDTVWFNPTGAGAGQTDTIVVTINDTNEDTVSGSTAFQPIRIIDSGANLNTYTLVYRIPQDSGSAPITITVTDTEGLQDSAILRFTADTIAPTVFSLSGPSADTLVVSTSITFSWSASADSLAGLSGYRLLIDTSPSFAVPVVDSFTGLATSVLRTLSANETWYWKVIATDRVGNTVTSETRGLMIDTVSPATFTVTAPADNLETSSVTFLFTWNAAADTPSGIGAYRLQADTGSSFTSPRRDSVAGMDTSGVLALPANDTWYWRVLAVDQAGNIRASASRRLVVDTRPPTAAVPLTPAHPTETNATAIAFSWTTSLDTTSGLSLYRLQCDTSGVFTSLLVDSATGLSTTATRALSANDTYFWRVISTDDAGNTTASSTSRVLIDTAPPAAASGLLPATAAETNATTIPFAWTAATDSLSGLTGQWLQIDTAGTFVALLVDSAVGSASMASRTMTPNDTYYWRILARDDAGNAAATAGQSIVIDTISPTAPALSAPASNLETNAVSLFFSWSASTETGAGVEAYRLQIDTSGTFTSLLVDSSTGLATTASRTLPANDTYFWRVRVSDGAGNTALSLARLLIIDTSIGTVALSAPADSTFTNDTTPLLSWSRLSDLAGIESYVIEVSRNSAFTSFAVIDTVSGSADSREVSPLGESTYFWRVRAIDQAGNTGIPSASRAIVIDTTPPDVTLIIPADLNETTVLTTRFRWQTANDAETYTWELSRQADFGALVASAVDTSATSIQATFAVDDTYYWRVTGRDRAGNQYSPASRRLLVDRAAPAVSLTAPAHNTYTNDSTPTFTWQIPADSSGIDSFVLQVDTAGTFTQCVLAETRAGTETSRTATPYLGENIYFWRMRAIDRLGNAGAWSSTWKLLIDTGVQLSVPPVDGETNIAAIRFSWESADAAWFTLQISRLPDFSALTDSVVETSAFFAVRTLTIEDTHYWRIIGRDTANNYDTTLVRIIVLDQSVGQVQLSSPADTTYTNDSTPSFSWNPLADSTAIETSVVALSTSPVFASISRTETVAGGALTATISAEMPQDSYYWRVRSYDRLGNMGAWSTSRRLILDTAPPTSPVPTTPATGIETRSVIFLFQWQGSADSVSAVTGYRLQLDTSGTFLAPTVDSSTGLSTTASRTLSANDTYFWRVVVTDSAGNTGASSVRSLVVDTTSPSAVLPANPAANAETSVTSIFFSWSASTDAHSGVEYYRLQVDTSGAFTSLLVDSSTGLSTAATRALPVNDTYFWRVVSADGAGNTTASATRALIIDTAAPTAATLISPAASSETNQLSFFFAWTPGVDALTALSDQKLQIDTTGTFTAPLIDSSVGVASAAVAALPANMLFYWRVKGFDRVGNASVSATRMVRTDTTPPGVALVSPADSALTKEPRPIFQWTLDSGIDARFQISTASNFLALIDQQETSVISFRTAVSLDSGRYYWRVVGRDTAGNTETTVARMLRVDTAANLYAPLAVARLTGRGQLLPNETTTLDATSSGDSDAGAILTYTWIAVPATGAIFSDSAAIVTTYSRTETGLVAIVLHVSDGETTSLSETIYVRVVHAPGDIIGGGIDGLSPSGRVWIEDLNALLPLFKRRVGDFGYDATFDLNGDGAINQDDFYILGRYYGQ